MTETEMRRGKACGCYQATNVRLVAADQTNAAVVGGLLVQQARNSGEKRQNAECEKQQVVVPKHKSRSKAQ